MHRLLVAVVVSLVLTSTAAARIRNPVERGYARGCTHGHVRSCIHRAAIHYRQSYGYLLSVAWCESRLNPSATNGQYAGLFQFGPNAWSRAHYSNHSPYQAKWAALAAAYMFSIGHSSEWSCA